jgi:hypothetical protein
MKKLSEHQLLLLRFFANGGVVVFCTSVSSQLGRYHFPSIKPEKFSKTIFFSLTRFGFIKEENEEIEFGIRWSEFGISERGLSFLDNLEDDNEEI